MPIKPVICEPDKFLFFDEIHPTTATHQLIGELAFLALKPTSIPEFSTVLGVLTVSTLFVFLRRKRHSYQQKVNGNGEQSLSCSLLDKNSEFESFTN